MKLFSTAEKGIRKYSDEEIAEKLNGYPKAFPEQLVSKEAVTDCIVRDFFESVDRDDQYSVEMLIYYRGKALHASISKLST